MKASAPFRAARPQQRFMTTLRRLVSSGRVTNSSGSSSQAARAQSCQHLCWVGNTPWWRHPTRISLPQEYPVSFSAHQPFARPRCTCRVAQLNRLNTAEGFCKCRADAGLWRPSKRKRDTEADGAAPPQNQGAPVSPRWERSTAHNMRTLRSSRLLGSVHVNRNILEP